MQNSAENLHPIVKEDLLEISSSLSNDLHLLQDKVVVITGSAGLLATYMTISLLFLNKILGNHPLKVISLSRSPLPKGHLLTPFLDDVNLHFIRHDVTEVLDPMPAFDYLILAATKGSPKDYLREEINTAVVNSLSLHRWMEAANDQNASSVLYISSGEVYGSPEQVPTPETYTGRIDQTLRRNIYAESKRFGEMMSLAHFRDRDLPVRIVRPFQIFGPGLKPDGRAFSDFIWNAIDQKKIVLRSAGRARRSFMYLSDATVAFLKVLLKGKHGSIYNVGTQEPVISILELAKTIASLSTKKVEVVLPTIEDQIIQDGAPQITCPDITKLKKEFDFRPLHDFEDMVQRVLSWAKDNRREYG